MKERERNIAPRTNSQLIEAHFLPPAIDLAQLNVGAAKFTIATVQGELAGQQQV